MDRMTSTMYRGGRHRAAMRLLFRSKREHNPADESCSNHAGTCARGGYVSVIRFRSRKCNREAQKLRRKQTPEQSVLNLPLFQRYTKQSTYGAIYSRKQLRLFHRCFPKLFPARSRGRANLIPPNSFIHRVHNIMFETSVIVQREKTNYGIFIFSIKCYLFISPISPSDSTRGLSFF